MLPFLAIKLYNLIVSVDDFNSKKQLIISLYVSRNKNVINLTVLENMTKDTGTTIFE